MTTELPLQEELRKLEHALLQPETRASREAMAALLADDFFEIGRSGRCYDKVTIIETLLAEQTDPVQIQMREFEVKQLAPDVVLATYRSIRIDVDEKMEALRSSIWRRIDGRWQIVFHQGTACPVR